MKYEQTMDRLEKALITVGGVFNVIGGVIGVAIPFSVFGSVLYVVFSNLGHA